ncbi:glycosyltransferase family 39 protein [Bacteroides sp. 224]|uniref:ArnT family glycosyltransferase n=1 Tax=Bacteroides sp. 224 TaxID=2302936 RepID=UPI0013D39163|nr:glycosyltransferase family 39 protein [Bacteroides sp. 224]NDV65849.1 phospholipid carrier-dependent glycosyltransferase [Bacteroides sp. 224]
MLNQKKSAIYYVLLSIVCFFAFFINNKVVPADLMEARNLATAQEMVRTGNYLLPTMNGELRIAKPPLPTWIAAGVEHILPDNLVAQRCMSGLSACIMVFFLFLLVRRLTKHPLPAFIAATVLASGFNIVMMGRTATWDIYCHSFMLGGIFFFVLATEEKGKQWLKFSLAGLFMGLSFLSKGPVSFYALLLPFIISYFAILRLSIKGKKTPLFCMILLIVIISFWWPVYIALFHPETGLAIANKESSAWLNHNVRPLWYYWKFPAEAGIWALFWVTSLIYFFWKKRSECRNVYLFSIVWTLAGFILLSLIPEKKTRYLLPLLIPGAINVGLYFYQSIKTAMTKGEKSVFRINGTIIGIVALALPFALHFIVPNESKITMLTVLITLLCIGLGIYIYTTLFNKKGIKIMPFFMASVLLMMVFESFCLAHAGKIFINDERHSIHALREYPDVQGLPFFYYDKEDIRMELVYEANQVILPMNIEDKDAIYAHSPFVFMSSQPIKELFKDKNVTIEFIDTFDNNWRKVTDKNYNNLLKKEVAIIRKKEVMEKNENP